MLASCGIFEPYRVHVEIRGDDATGKVTEIRYINPSNRTARFKIQSATRTDFFNIPPGTKTIAIRSLGLTMTGSGANVFFDGGIGLKS